MSKVDIIFVLSMFHGDTIRFNIIHMAYIMFLLYITENVKIKTE